MTAKDERGVIVPFPSPQLREQLALERTDRLFDETLAVAEYDWDAAVARMKRFLDADNPPTLQLCAARWLIERAGLLDPKDPPMRPSDV